MKKELYYSYRLSGESSDNEYQLSFKNYFRNANGVIKTKKSGKLPFNSSLLNLFFIVELWKCDIVEVEKFLDYHYQKYVGDKLDFITHTEFIIKIKLKEYDNELESLKNFSVFKAHLRGIGLKAETCFKWIEKKKNLTPQQSITVLDNQSKETSVNPYPKIFTSYKGFQLFEAFKTEIVVEATEYADYSFLFAKLKKDEFIHDIKHKKFIDFLSKEYKAKFAENYIQFKYSETLHKKNTYSRLKKHFL